MTREVRPNDSNDTQDQFRVTNTYTTYRPGQQHGQAQEAVIPQATPLPEIKLKRRLNWKKALFLMLIVLLVPILVIGVMNYRNASGASQKLFGSGNLLGVLPPNELKSTAGRTNILIIGNSADDPGHAGANLTDSIMVVSMNKSSQTGYMLSIPRDLYVEIPDYGTAKINEAFQAGDRQSFTEAGYPSGGVGLLQKVIKDTFGLPIDYSVVVGYGAVREITDALGGITVTVESPDPRGIYDPNFKPGEGGPLKLSNGPQALDGQTALRLTRARGSTSGSYGFPQSDFNRTQNQQKVFAAIKNEITLGQLIDPRQNKPLFDAVANNTKTDLDLDALLPLFRLFTAIPNERMKQINLTDVDGKNLLGSYRTPTGQSALVPAAGIDDYSEIQKVLEQFSQ